MRMIKVHRFGPIVLIAVLMPAACISLSSCWAAEDADVTKLLQTFVDELIVITPGEGKFPADLVRPGAGKDGANQSITMDGQFAIAKYEVPQNLYEAVMGENPSKWKGPRNSVEMMTWKEAIEFAEILTQRLRDANLIDATEEIRLPTEIEWEYCCRAGTKTRYSFGDAAQAPGDEDKQASLLDEYGWHTGNASGNDPPVGALKPNPWGLYDVHGYLWEFCSDPWSQAVIVDPAARKRAAQSKQIVIRGGSWKDRFTQLTSGSRRSFSADGRDDAIGFRCVKARAPQE